MRLEVSCKDRVGITQDVLDILVEYEIDLRGIEIDEKGKIFLNFPNIEFANFQHLMPKIRLLDGVEDVKTTPFMPTEREQYQLQALLQTLPDPVLTVDTKARVMLANDVVVTSIGKPKEQILGTDISELVKGFNIYRWLENKMPESESKLVTFLGQDYLLDILPVKVPASETQDILAGAVLLFKSESRLGQQFNYFQRYNVDSFSSLSANSKKMRQLVKDAKRLAQLDAPILIFGETGSGKTLLAKACQQGSARHDKPFFTFNCIGVTEAETNRILFGCDETKNKGLLTEANEGTLLIEEIAELPLGSQGRLLNALARTNQNSPVSQKQMNVRLICTTEKNLAALIEQNVFRKDLFYQLNQLSMVIPSLKERKADIPALVDHFLNKQSLQIGRTPPTVSLSCKQYLQAYSWVGNVKQLENAVLLAVSLLQGDELTIKDISLPASPNVHNDIAVEFEGSLDDEVKRYEKDILTRLYPYYPSTRLLAKKLGLSHTAIANKLREYAISKP